MEVAVAAIAAGAALIAAIIAAVSAGQRQARQLNHDAERQDRELQHDRSLRNKEELRNVLDDAGQAIFRTHRALIEICGAYQAEDTIDWAPLQEPRDQAIFATARLEIRLGYDHEIAEAYREVIRISLELSKAVQKTELDAAARKKSVDDLNAKLLAARNTFIEKARRLVGSLPLED